MHFCSFIVTLNLLQVPTSNLVNDEEDFSEFEAFEGEATPRGPAPEGGKICVC